MRVTLHRQCPCVSGAGDDDFDIEKAAAHISEDILADAKDAYDAAFPAKPKSGKCILYRTASCIRTLRCHSCLGGAARKAQSEGACI